MKERGQIVEILTEYLSGLTSAESDRSITETVDLREFAEFDSLKILETLVWLENTFAVTIPDEELVVDRFNSIDKMANFVLAHQK